MDDRQRPRHLHKTMVDYVAIAIAPAFIMLLIGSLVFFLVDAFYSGTFVFRLKFIFSMFVIATVLIGRISMEEGTEYAMLYAIPLAIVSMMAFGMFAKVTGPLAAFGMLINGGLLAIIWFSAHQLTWDCTLIDDQKDASGQGLLEAAGLDQSSGEEADSADQEDTPGTTSREDPERTWWEWYKQRQRRPHAPGLWVIYFSIAALALFGSVSMFVPADKQEQSFQYLVVFVASALALLMSTSFLGLRRYLRQRQLEMDADMAATWLTAGTILIVVMLVFCALLPRPGGMTLSAKDLPISWSGPKSPQTSKYGFGPEGVKTKQPGGSSKPSKQQGGSGESKQQGDSGESKQKPRQIPPRPFQQDNQFENQARQQDNRSSKSGASKQAKKQARSKNLTKPGGSKQSGGKQGAKKGSQKSSGKRSKQPSKQAAKQRQSKSQEQNPNQGVDLTGESPSHQGNKKSKQAAQKKDGKKDGKQGGGKKQSGRSKQPSKGRGKQDGKKEDRPSDADKKKGKSENKNSSQGKGGKKNQQSDKEQRESRGGGSGSSKSKSKKDESKKQGDKQDDKQNDKNDDSKKQDEEQKQRSSGSKGSQSKEKSKGSSSASTPPKSTPRKSWNWPKFSLSTGLMLLLKLAFYGLLIAVTVYLVWKYRRELHQAWISFLEEMRRLWERLFGGGDGSPSEDAEEGATQTVQPAAPFASFSNPFSGHSGMQAPAMIHYTFDAFVAWAREHGCKKDLDDTPLEFARFVAATHSTISSGSRTLAEIYCRLAYDSQYEPSPQDVEQLRGLWNQMQQS